MKNGYSLIELMIVVAIIAIISSIAIPAYNGYIRESKYSAALASIDTMKVFLEDYRLENSGYVSQATMTEAQILTNYGWSPRDNDSPFTFSIKSGSTTTYTIVATHSDGETVVECNESGTCTYTP